MSKIHGKSIAGIARMEYTKLVFNPRIILVGMLLLVIKNMVAVPLIERSVKMGEPLNIAELFLAVCNSPTFLLFIPGVFLVMVSDFPDIGTHTLFTIKRSGKINWLLGQVLSVFLFILTYVLIVFLACCAFVSGHCFIGTDWSDTVTKYLSRFPEERDGVISELLPSNLYNQISFRGAFLHTLFFLILYMLLLALVLLLFRILYLKSAGIFAVVLLVAAGQMTMVTGSRFRWFFPQAHALTWGHFMELMRKPVMPMENSYFYFAVLTAVLLVANIIIMKRADISTGEE